MHTLFCETFDCLNFLKEHNTFIDLPKIIYFKVINKENMIEFKYG